MQSLDKNIGLETNPQKATVRKDLMEQIISFSQVDGELQIFTLPGIAAFFEHKLVDRCLKDDIDLEIFCAENNKYNYSIARKNIPSSVHLWNGNLNSIIYKEILNKGYLCDAMWIDHCRPLTFQDIQDCVDHVRFVLKDEGLYYFSSNLCGGHISNGKKGVHNILLGHQASAPCSVDDDKISNEFLRDEIVRIFMKTMKDRGLSKVTKIYDVLYSGGGIGNTPMVTLGFAVGMRRDDDRYPTVIIENRRRRYKVKKKFSKNISPKERVYMMLKNGCENEVIMQDLGISKGSLSAYKANLTMRKII